ETPKLFVSDLQVIEGNSGTTDALVTVSLNAPDLNSTITAGFTTIGQSASPADDFLPRGGLLTFAPGVRTRTVVVPIVGDRFNEATETFLVQLTSATGADIVDGTGVVTILDNDPLPNFYVSDVQVTATTSGLASAVFTVALDIASGRDVTV